MKLNSAQKELILNRMFEPWDLYKYFETSNKNDILSCDWEIYKGNYSGWYVLNVDDRKVTELNFDYHSDVLEEIKKGA